VATQLSFPDYILENRLPSLGELGDRLPATTAPKPVKYTNPFKRKIRYPSNWSEGDRFNDSPENIFLVCSKHHLDIHRGTDRIPPKGQQNLFDLNLN
jgi:hypothetical protein